MKKLVGKRRSREESAVDGLVGRTGDAAYFGSGRSVVQRLMKKVASEGGLGDRQYLDKMVEEKDRPTKGGRAFQEGDWFSWLSRQSKLGI